MPAQGSVNEDTFVHPCVCRTLNTKGLRRGPWDAPPGGARAAARTAEAVWIAPPQRAAEAARERRRGTLYPAAARGVWLWLLYPLF